MPVSLPALTAAELMELHLAVAAQMDAGRGDQAVLRSLDVAVMEAWYAAAREDP